MQALIDRMHFGESAMKARCRLLIAGLGLCAIWTGLAAAEPPKSERKGDVKMLEPVKLTEEALRIHQGGLLVDGHNDLPWAFREKKDMSFTRIDIRKDQSQTGLHTDIPRLRQGGVGAQFWSAYVPVRGAKDHTALRQTLEQMDVIYRMVQTYPDTFEMAYSTDDILRIHREGKIASLIGIEGGHSIDNSLAALRMLYKLGARYMTLTHTENTDWADSATDEPKNHGLSPFGEQVVAEMNRLGMLVDISHVSADTMRHVLRVSRAPIIASHSSAYALAQSPRNVPDDVLREIHKKGGVVMVNFFSGFIVPEAARATMEMFKTARELRKKYPKEDEFLLAFRAWQREHPMPRGSVRQVVDHIEHIIKVAGIDNVGLGSDFDGVTSLPRQLDDVSYYPYITQELLNRGHGKEDIHKILGGNLLRVMRQVEEAAKNGKS
jgi:membrane dipeptidase